MSPAPARRGFFERLATGLQRRVHYAWSRLTGSDECLPIEPALAWLLDQDTGQGLPPYAGAAGGCPAATGACLETILNYGYRDVARRWAQWLLSVQLAHGGFDDPSDARSFDRTAWAVQGLTAMADVMPGVEPSIQGACEYLCAWLDAQAAHAVNTEEEDAIGNRLPCVTPLLQAGRRWANTDWIMSAFGAIDCFAAPESGEGLLPFVNWVELVLQRDGVDAARQMMEPILSCQQPNGSIRTVLGFESARVASLWYRLGWSEHADRVLQYLEQRLGDGVPFELSEPWLGERAGTRVSVWAAKFYLDAALDRVRAAFDATWQDFPATIDPADGRVEAVGRWLRTMAGEVHVADVGCGQGRFLRHLAARFPQARWTGIDISPAMLAGLPDTVDAREGSLLRIPAADGEFDAAFAVEVLEHALVPERAIAELCRVVRPGGRVLVIDKRQAKQPLSDHDRWERWFTPEELRDWLSAFCNGVKVRAVAHLEGRPGRDLFLAAEGVRRKG